MRIIVLMTSIAIGRSFVLIQLSCVTAFTSGGTMGAEQRVLGVLFVVEKNGFPGFLAVALLAPLSEIVSVNVILLMTAKTICRGLVFVEVPLVATLAFRFSMVSLERIRSVSFVIE